MKGGSRGRNGKDLQLSQTCMGEGKYGRDSFSGNKKEPIT